MHLRSRNGAVVLPGKLSYLSAHILVRALQLVVLELELFDLLSQILLYCVGLGSSTSASALPLRAWLGSIKSILSRLLLGHTVHILLKVGSISVYAAQVLVQILLAGEALASVALAVMVWTVELLAWAAVLVMHFALMTKQSTRVCKAWELLATLGWTLIWAIVLVHMLTVGSC